MRLATYCRAGTRCASIKAAAGRPGTPPRLDRAGAVHGVARFGDTL
jgi:hypothetical protein